MNKLMRTRFGSLGPDNAGIPLSEEEFMEHDDWVEGPRYELLGGVLVVSPATSQEERFPNHRLGTRLEIYQLTHPNGACVDATINEGDIRTSSGIRRFDRAVWTNLSRLPQEPGDVPSIIVDFVSYGKRNADRDYVVKRDEYLEIGVKEYWVIDRFDLTMSVFTGTRESPQQRIVQGSEDYTTPLLPGFVLSLKEIFSLADQIAKSKDR